MPKSKHNTNNLDGVSNESDNILKEINEQLTEANEYVAKKISITDHSTIDSSDVPDVMTDDMLSDINDNMSIDEETANKLDEEAKESYLQNDVFEAIVKYMEADDIIHEKESEHRDEIAPLKKQRSSLEVFLIDYLDHIDQEFIKIGEKTQLTRVETVSKAPIKSENVAEALVEGFKKHELYTDDQHDEMLKVIKDMIQIVESKREQKTKKKISRINLEKQTKKNAKEEANKKEIKKEVNKKEIKKEVNKNEIKKEVNKKEVNKKEVNKKEIKKEVNKKEVTDVAKNNNPAKIAKNKSTRVTKSVKNS
jgi:hypothetical protein